MNLERFIEVQLQSYARALAEIENGRKTSHWMWFIFPQISGLGYSEMAIKYGIADLNEAQHYYQHPILGPRLIAITHALLAAKTNNANEVMGSPDDLKLRSSMTLFAEVAGADSVFQKVLDKFFKGQKDPKTLALLQQQGSNYSK